MYYSTDDSNQPKVRSFFQNLTMYQPEKSLSEVAHFFGFADQYSFIERSCRGLTPMQCQLLLRLVRIPDCGCETDTVLQCLSEFCNLRQECDFEGLL